MAYTLTLDHIVGSCHPLPTMAGARVQERSAQGRIHVIAGEPVCVLDDALFIDIHEDLLPTHGTHAVGEVFGGHARLAVELEERGREGQEGCERDKDGLTLRLRSGSREVNAGAQSTFSFSLV